MTPETSIVLISTPSSRLSISFIEFMFVSRLENEVFAKRIEIGRKNKCRIICNSETSPLNTEDKKSIQHFRLDLPNTEIISTIQYARYIAASYYFLARYQIVDKNRIC